MKKIGLLLPIIFLSFAHPFFVSLTEIIYNPKSKSIEISVRTITHDIEKELEMDCQCKVDLSQKELHTEMEPVLKNYLTKSIKIQRDGKPLIIQFLGFEKEEENIWAYLEVKNQTEPKNLFVENKILHQTQKKQVNLVRFKKKDFDKTHQLKYPQSIFKF